MLKNSNIEVDFASNGKETIDKIKRKIKYDVILLDEELSQITGDTLLKKLKELRNFNISAVLLTKDSSYEYNQEYVNQGIDDYIIKPIKKDVLFEKLDRFMNK